MPTLVVKANAGCVGEKISVKGSGLEKGVLYDLVFAGSKVATFRTTASGSVPPHTSLVVPEIPSVGSKGELGSRVSVDAVPRHGNKETAASAEFELQASVSCDSDRAHFGDTVTVHGRGLLPNETYQISLISPGYIPFAAGLMDTGPNGSGTTAITVADYIGAGPFQIDLLNRKEVYRALQKTAPIRILGFSYRSLAAGRPKRSTGGLNCPVRISIPFKNNSSITFLPVVYAIIYNAEEQPIQITSSGAGLQPHSTEDVVFCFANLQKGKYKIGVFATTQTGRVLSKLFSFPLEV